MRYSSVALNPKEEAVLALIKDPVYENYFFNKVSDVKWFETLKERGYFKSEKAPGPIPADEKGYVTIPVWNVLPYLEKISKQVNEPGDEKYIDELLIIIREVTEYHKTTKTLHNYNTWSYFVKIIVNIPSANIPKDIIDFIPIWLDSKYLSTFLSHDLALKLLPKFLPENPSDIDIEKAEKVFESLFEIRWKEKPKGYIETLAGMRDEPYLLVDQHWLIDSLINRRNAHKVGEKCSEKPIYILADKLKTIFRHEHSGSSFDVNIDNKAYRIVVNHTNDFEFSCCGGLIDDKAYSEVKAQEKLFRKMLYVPETQFSFMISNCQVAVDFANQMILKLEEKRLGKIEDDFSCRMEDFYDHIFNDYSYIWYRNIADAPHYIPTSVKELIAYIMREVTTSKVNKDKTCGKNIIEKFLSKDFPYPLFRRIGVFIVGEYWDAYSDIFGDLLESKDIEVMLDDPHYEAELYSLLEKNILKLSPKFKEQLQCIVNKGPQRHSFDEIEEKEKYINYWKQKWYSALKADTEFAKLYDHYYNLTKTKEHISFKEYGVRTRSGPGPSPLSAEQILSMSNNKIANFLTTFKTKDWWEGPTVEGLAETLKNLAKVQPEKFIDDLHPFISTAYLYNWYILWGIREAWNNKKLFDWGRLLEYIRDYINQPAFWQDKLPIAGDHWKPDHTVLISSIGSLIQDGTKDDTWAFDEEYNELAIEIMKIILTDVYINKLNTKPDDREGDYIVDIHNTPLGNVIIALIYLSLRIARLQCKKTNGKSIDHSGWNELLKKLYETTIEKEVIEAYTILGQYLPNIIYLDSAWAEKKIIELEKPSRKEFREAFISGYLNIVRVYDNIYRLVSMQKHYEWALETALAKHTNEQLVSHITIGYLRGYSDLFDKITEKEKWNIPQILGIIEFFWRESRYLLKPDIENRNEMIARVVEFWNKIYERYKEKTNDLSEDDKKILSNIVKLTIYFEKIDKKEFDWLMLSVPYVHIESNERWLFEYLDGLKEKDDKITSTKHILQIILKMLESSSSSHTPDYLKSIISYAYELSDRDIKQMANDICNIIGASGFDYLRPVYEKYNE